MAAVGDHAWADDSLAARDELAVLVRRAGAKALADAVVALPHEALDVKRMQAHVLTRASGEGSASVELVDAHGDARKARVWVWSPERGALVCRNTGAAVAVLAEELLYLESGEEVTLLAVARALDNAEPIDDDCAATPATVRDPPDLEESMAMVSAPEVRTQLAGMMDAVAALMSDGAVIRVRGGELAAGAKVATLVTIHAAAFARAMPSLLPSLELALVSVTLGTIHDLVLGELQTLYAAEDTALNESLPMLADELTLVALDAPPALHGVKLGSAEALLAPAALAKPRTPIELARSCCRSMRRGGHGRYGASVG
ncbi:uncharacterized protein AMSG_00791 [Thecamonas trahens ATCC 50062]|uniref:Uncharacterized protein n=1 Tax=Thecamonas trahens ATCC 50062 TaxID=461836 RepID=A0A0L0DEB4_THETB|nr:hypothetical protein AMSG_00791 [Thecamonas trahens ATCC 50062]KNC50629.1 hypothetical protein AMSG_00791 [Thecamonas trahens ATCC 50062]|eukprot:XP_013762515.1 hypothetical protein AMSG_00791 [Thecamonas trahens ATCC 50062]